MAQMVKAVRMILGMEAFGPVWTDPLDDLTKDIEIEDDAPERKPSIEELDALEVPLSVSLSMLMFFPKMNYV